MTGQKSARRQAPAALRLQRENRQDGTLATCDAEPVGAGFDDMTGSLRRDLDRGRLDLGP